MPSYWIRQVRHTNASNPDALTERKTKETKKQKKGKKKRCHAHPGDVTDKTKQCNNTEYDQERQERTGKPKHNKSTFEAAAAVCGTSSIGRFYLLRSRSGTLPPCLPSPSCFHFVNRGFPTTATRPVPIPLDATRNGSAALPIQFRLIVVRNTNDSYTSRKMLFISIMWRFSSLRPRGGGETVTGLPRPFLPTPLLRP